MAIENLIEENERYEANIKACQRNVKLFQTEIRITKRKIKANEELIDSLTEVEPDDGE